MSSHGKWTESPRESSGLSDPDDGAFSIVHPVNPSTALTTGHSRLKKAKGSRTKPASVTSLNSISVMKTCTAMMKSLIKKKGIASIPELREAAIESDVRFIGCQMTMDLFEGCKDDLIDGIEIGGAATYMETALKSDINLYI